MKVAADLVETSDRLEFCLLIFFVLKRIFSGPDGKRYIMEPGKTYQQGKMSCLCDVIRMRSFTMTE